MCSSGWWCVGWQPVTCSWPAAMSRECWTLLGSMPRCRRSSTVLSPTACDVCVAPLQSAGWPCERCPRAGHGQDWLSQHLKSSHPQFCHQLSLRSRSLYVYMWTLSVSDVSPPLWSQSIFGVGLFWESVCFRSQSIFGVSPFQESVYFWSWSVSGVSPFQESVHFWSRSIFGVSLFWDSVHFWSRSVLGVSPYGVIPWFYTDCESCQSNWIHCRYARIVYMALIQPFLVQVQTCHQLPPAVCWECTGFGFVLAVMSDFCVQWLTAYVFFGGILVLGLFDSLFVFWDFYGVFKCCSFFLGLCFFWRESVCENWMQRVKFVFRSKSLLLHSWLHFLFLETESFRCVILYICDITAYSVLCQFFPVNLLWECIL